MNANKRKYFFLGFLCVSTAVAATPPQFTLPDGVRPLRHVIEMTIDPARDTFTGIAKIDVMLESAQPVLWVNGKDLTVSAATIGTPDHKYTAKVELAGGEFIGLTPEKPVGPGSAVITIHYQAPLSAEAREGPFRKKVGDDWYQFTVFTPIDARRAFPCFDEPRFKTQWDLSIRVRREHRAFANAPMVSETDEPDGMKLVRFAPTRRIAAEVVAFAVGPFDVFDGVATGPKQTPVRVITARGQVDQGREAALATEIVLPRLERYTGMPYPWAKLDHVALPQGAFGAVENPGLITYISRGLLLSGADDTEDRRRGLRGLQAHEIGHQWFGNLVTQADWTEVWLSEGFATWISAKMMDEEQPADRKHLAAVAARERIMAADDGPNTRPVRLPMHNREELKSVYHQIVYQKGGAVLLMLENWVGENRFREGLGKYLAGHGMANATTRDLEAELPPEATPVMDAFLNTTGVPVVSAEVECAGTPRIVFHSDKSSVPICWKTPATAQTCTVASEAALPLCPAWVYPNANGAGYYRTAWTAAQLQALSAGLSSLNGAERLTLAYDLRVLRKSGKLDASATDPILNELAKDGQPEIVHAAKVALGLETEQPPQRRRQ